MIKNGFNQEKQRFKCKKCKREQRPGDQRVKFDNIYKKQAIAMYLEGCGFRRIARLLQEFHGKKFDYQLAIHWIKKAGKIVEEKMQEPLENKEIPVVEMDELYTFIKKNGIKSKYGLLSTEIGAVLLRLKSDR